MEPFPSLIFSFDGSFLVLISPPFLRKKDITPEISNNQFSFFGVGCFLFSKKGRKRALACVPHQINKFYVRTACFFGGVIFCGEELWEKGGGSVFFCFLLLLLLFFFFLSLFPFAFIFSYVCLYGLHCLIWLAWLALLD